MIAELMAVVGFDASTYSLRELLWMAEAKRREAWNHTSSLMALIANCHRPSKQRAYSAEDFHPMCKDRSSGGIPLKYLSIADMAGAMGIKGGPKKVPAPLTSEGPTPCPPCPP